MEWDKVLRARPSDVEKDETLLENLYAFFLHNELPLSAEEGPPQLQDKDGLLRVLHVLRSVMRVKGLEAQAAEEDLRELNTQYAMTAGQVGSSEQDLVEQIVQLEKELRHKDDIIESFQQRVGSGRNSPSVLANETRHLRDEVEDLMHELAEVKRSLTNERSQNDRLMKDSSSERLRSRQMEREVNDLKHNLEDYRKQFDWRREQGQGTAARNTVEADFRERLRKKDSEMAEQLDKIEELVNYRDSLEHQLRDLTLQMAHVEEQRLTALKDLQNMKTALAESDLRCDELETQNKLLGGQMTDLQEQLTQHKGADDHVFSLVNAKAKEWEVLLASKEAELASSQEKVKQLEEQLKAVEQHSNRITLLKMKKELQSREAELLTVQKELSEATAQISSLSSQLEEFQGVHNSTLNTALNSALKQELEHAKMKQKMLESDLTIEVNRREQAEAEKEEKDEELVQALGRMGEYERGEYGLHEAVMEIKVKKEEVAIRDKDIAELTQQVNQLENELNQLGEENEALRERAGVKPGDRVDVQAVRARRASELERLQKDNRMLQKEVEKLEEDKFELRKQVLDHAIARSSPAIFDSASRSQGTPSHAAVLEVEGLNIKTRELERALNEERRGKEVCQNEVEVLRGQAKQAKEKLKQLEEVVRELRGAKEPRGFKSEALNRLIALLEVEGCGENMALVLQLKSQLSEQTGQKEILTQQLQRAERESKRTLRELERKQCELENLSREVTNLKKLQSGFQPIPFPEGIPLSSSEVIASLNEQLLQALNELHSREEALEKATGALEKFQRKFAVIIHQQGVLYQEYSEGRSKWEEQMEKAKKDSEKLTVEHETDKVKVQELEALQASLAGGEDEVRKRLGEMSRKMTLLQVNEKVLARKHHVLLEREAALRKENSQLLNDKLQMEKSVTEKVAYLQRHKETALFKLSSLQEQLSVSVSCAELDKANRQYNNLAIKYQELLSQQTAYTTTTGTLEQLQAEVHTLTGQLDEVKREVSVEKIKNRLFEGSASSGDGRVSKGQSAGRREQEFATLEMKALNEKQRADLATSRLQKIQEVMAQLEKRNTTLEEKFSELTQRLLQAQLNESELRDQLASSLPEAEKSSLEGTIAELSKAKAQLDIENSHLKEVAEVARQQAIAVEMIQTSHDLEMTSLRQQVFDLQGTSDEKAAMGRLHHQLLALQVSEATALKRVEVAQAKIIKLEAHLLRSEQGRDKESEAVFQCRAQSINKVRHLRSTIQSLRRQYAGALPLSECEHHAQLIRKTKNDRREAEILKKEARMERDQVQDKLLELGVQQSNLEELIRVLRDSTPESTTSRLTEWHAKLGEMRLVELRLSRANEKMKEKIKHLEDLVATSESSFAKLEQELVTITKDHEASQLSWELREAQLEKQLEACSQKSSDRLLDPQLSSSGQLQEALLRLQESSHDKVVLSHQLQTSKKEAGQLEIALSRARAELLEKEGEMIRLKGEVETLRKANQAKYDDKEEEEKALISAQESLKRLQAQLSDKEQLAEKYQQMLQDARRELQKEISAHNVEVATLRAKLTSQDDKTISELKRKALEAINVPAPVVATDKQLERLLVLEESAAQHDQKLQRLKQQVIEEKRERELTEQNYEERISMIKLESKEQTQRFRQEMEALRGKLVEKESRVSELEQEVEVLEGELSAAQQAAKQAPSRTMKALVERLRNQLSIKEKQQRALSQALLQVRADLVETAQKTLEGEGEKDIQEANVRQIVERKTSDLQLRIQDLNTGFEEVKGQLLECQHREKKVVEKMKQLKAELEEKNSKISYLQKELQRIKKALEKSRGNELKITEELGRAVTAIETNPQFLQLQNTVKVLQAKLEKQKELNKSLEQHKSRDSSPLRKSHDSSPQRKLRDLSPQRKSRDSSPQRKLRDLSPQCESHDSSPKAGRKGLLKPPLSGVDRESLIDRKHQAVEVMRWEEGKKWQKKISVLQNKLTEKSKQLEAAQKQLTTLKDLQSRGERERSLLQAKIKSLQKQCTDGGRTSSGTKDAAEPEGNSNQSGHSVAELERVINAMRKVIERLQAENEGLKKSGSATSLRASAQSKVNPEKQISALKEENTKLKAELEKQQSTSRSGLGHPSKSPHSKIVAENDRLIKDLKKEVSKNEKLQLSLSTLQLQHNKLEGEVKQLKKCAADISGEDDGQEVKMEELQAELEKKTSMLMEVKKHLKEAALRERELKDISGDPQLSEKYLAVMKERDDLKKETTQLRKELDAFDPSFFEEIEDLKFNYQESLRKNAKLEERLTKLTRESVA